MPPAESEQRSRIIRELAPGGSAGQIAIAEGLAARGAGSPAVELDGRAEELKVSGGFASAPPRPEGL